MCDKYECLTVLISNVITLICKRSIVDVFMIFALMMKIYLRNMYTTQAIACNIQKNKSYGPTK